MRYAEVHYTEDGRRHGLLLGFEDNAERNAACYDFLQRAVFRGDKTATWEDMSWSCARKSYDLARFNDDRYLRPVEVFDFRSGNPMATRYVSGIETTSEATARMIDDARATLLALA